VQLGRIGFPTVNSEPRSPWGGQRRARNSLFTNREESEGHRFADAAPDASPAHQPSDVFSFFYSQRGRPFCWAGRIRDARCVRDAPNGPQLAFHCPASIEGNVGRPCGVPPPNGPDYDHGGARPRTLNRPPRVRSGCEIVDRRAGPKIGVGIPSGSKRAPVFAVNPGRPGGGPGPVISALMGIPGGEKKFLKPPAVSAFVRAPRWTSNGHGLSRTRKNRAKLRPPVGPTPAWMTYSKNRAFHRPARGTRPASFEKPNHSETLTFGSQDFRPASPSRKIVFQGSNSPRAYDHADEIPRLGRSGWAIRGAPFRKSDAPNRRLPQPWKFGLRTRTTPATPCRSPDWAPPQKTDRRQAAPLAGPESTFCYVDMPSRT